ncbi:MAG: hypothetical protein HY751_13845 [Nitrospinae bacterium]|nr:hypothetical protein [Nitrospinota bacterium]
MNNRICLVVAALLVFLGTLASTRTAQAIPAFSKKYEIACSACHGSFPRLNDFGSKFKLNGFQLPASEDGGSTAKLNPAENLFLDIGKASPPISIILDGGVTIIQAAKGEFEDKNNKFFCCVNGNSVTADLGGTVAPNIGYWLSLPWGKEEVAQANIRFVNWFGPGYVSMDLGAMRVMDYDVVSPGREWFAAPLVAFHGHPYLTSSTEEGFGAAHNDTGVRIYGRPSYGPFTYEVGMFTGAQLVGAGDDDQEHAYTFMGRVDVDKFSTSLRFWTNKTGLTDVSTPLSSGETISFPASGQTPDETTQEMIVSASYKHPYFEVDVTVDRSSFTLGQRTALGTDGVSHTYSQSSQNRLGASIGIVWLVNSWMETGLAYGYSKMEDYTVTVDGAESTIKGNPVSLAQWRLDIRPTANLKVGFEAQLDTSSADSRKRSDGTEFDPQNKVLLTWKLAI